MCWLTLCESVATDVIHSDGDPAHAVVRRVGASGGYASVVGVVQVDAGHPGHMGGDGALCGLRPCSATVIAEPYPGCHPTLHSRRPAAAGDNDAVPIIVHRAEVDLDIDAAITAGIGLACDHFA